MGKGVIINFELIEIFLSFFSADFLFFSFLLLPRSFDKKKNIFEERSVKIVTHRFQVIVIYISKIITHFIKAFCVMKFVYAYDDI